jgi:hypothetical protein
LEIILKSVAKVKKTRLQKVIWGWVRIFSGTLALSIFSIS